MKTNSFNKVVYYIINKLMIEKYIIYSELKKLYNLTDEDFENIVRYLKKNNGIELFVSEDYIFFSNDFHDICDKSKKINFI